VEYHLLISHMSKLLDNKLGNLNLNDFTFYLKAHEDHSIENDLKISYLSKAINIKPKEPGYYVGDIESGFRNYNMASKLVESESNFLNNIVFMILITRSRMYIKQRQFQKAIYVLEEAETYSPSNCDVLLFKSIAFAYLGNTELSMILLQDLIKEYPNNPEPYAVRCKIYEHLGKIKESYADLELLKLHSQEKHPDITSVTKSLLTKIVFLKNDVRVEYAKKNLEASLTMLNQAIEMFPFDFGLYHQRVAIYRDLCKYENAMHDLDIMEGFGIKDHEGIVNDEITSTLKAWALHAIDKKDYLIAIEKLDRVISLNPQDVSLLKSRGGDLFF
jgi:tetratricopeptide (TPR) repeat protein